MKGPVRAILFDAGATLLHPDPPVESVYARELAVDGALFSGAELTRALTRTWEEVRSEGTGDRYGGVQGEPEFWRGFLNRVRARLDGATVSSEAFERLAGHFRDPSSWAVYDDVAGTLGALERSGFLLAVVSNWDSYLPTLLEALGLARHFSVIVVSAMERMGKPDPEIFRRACARLHVLPEEALHVGDSLREDYEGAKLAGLRALLLDRQDRHAGVSGRIRSLAELLDRLPGTSGRRTSELSS